MAKRTVGLVMGLFLVVFLFGCGLLQDGSSSGGGSSYFPWAQGYGWRFNSSDGSWTISTVEGTVQIGSNTVDKIKSFATSSSGSTSTGESYCRVNSNGVYIYPSLTTTEPFTLVSFPLQVNKKWTYYSYPIGGGVVTHEIRVAVKENVTVSAGTFDSYKLQLLQLYGTAESTVSYLWLGNNAGIVKSTSPSSTIETTLSWKSF